MQTAAGGVCSEARLGSAPTDRTVALGGKRKLRWVPSCCCWPGGVGRASGVKPDRQRTAPAFRCCVAGEALLKLEAERVGVGLELLQVEAGEHARAQHLPGGGFLQGRHGVLRRIAAEADVVV